MFNGIIEELGNVVGIKESEGREFAVQASFVETLAIGDSVAVNGVCTTVIGVEGNGFRVFASSETLGITNLSDVALGDKVNLERSLIYGSRINGHIVYGHVDKTLPLVSREEKSESWLLRLALGVSDEGLVIPKGSVALNGISLTVYDLAPDSLTVMIIPHTYHHTNISLLKVGSRVNCEFDSLGKFLQQHAVNYLKNTGFRLDR